jgi:alkylhydroperoxidase/carboxymuconolactone decarboxylase family protein YurZ
MAVFSPVLHERRKAIEPRVAPPMRNPASTRNSLLDKLPGFMFLFAMVCFSPGVATWFHPITGSKSRDTGFLTCCPLLKILPGGYAVKWAIGPSPVMLSLPPQTHPAYSGSSQSLPLERKTQHLVKLGTAIGIGSEGDVQNLCAQALADGLSPEAIRHAVLLTATTAGFPAMIAAMQWAEEIMAKKGDK